MALLSIFTLVSIERAACGFKIERYRLHCWGKGFKHNTYKATCSSFLPRVNQAMRNVCLFRDAASPHGAEECAIHSALIQKIFPVTSDVVNTQASRRSYSTQVTWHPQNICWLFCEAILTVSWEWHKKLEVQLACIHVEKEMQKRPLEPDRQVGWLTQRAGKETQ